MSKTRTIGKVAAYSFFPLGTAAMLTHRSYRRKSGDFHKKHPLVYFAFTFLWWLAVLATAGVFALLWYAVEWLFLAIKGEPDNVDDDADELFEQTSSTTSGAGRGAERDTLAFMMEVCALRQPTEIRTEVSEARLQQEGRICLENMRRARQLGVDLRRWAKRLEEIVGDPEWLATEETRSLLSAALEQFPADTQNADLREIQRSIESFHATLCFAMMCGVAPESLDMQILPGFMLVKPASSNVTLAARMIRAYEKFLFEWQLQALLEEGFRFDRDANGIPAAFNEYGEVCHRFYEAADPESELGRTFTTHLEDYEPFV